LTVACSARLSGGAGSIPHRTSALTIDKEGIAVASIVLLTARRA
jgi:hypothetical protein